MSYTTQQDILDFVEDNNVKFVRFAFCDIFGTQKNIAVLASDLPKALEDGVCFDGSSIAGFMKVEESDLVLRPDLSTVTILPWRPTEGRVMQFFCDVEKPDGAPFGGNCRGFLRQMSRKFRKLGLTCNVGAECEFYLFENDDHGRPTRVPIDFGGYFDVAPLDAGENLRRDICLTMEQMGMSPQHSHHESGNGQNEIDCHHAGPLKTADNVMMFKQIVRAVAMRSGIHASFLPKPLVDQAGSGLHINLSLYMDGRNLFEGDIAPDSIAGSFMAGVLAHSRELTVFTNPLPNSYLRFGSDEDLQTFGIRTLSWGKKGILLNGERVIVQGACIHHDQGILGARCYAQGEERRVRLLKENGYNAVRSAHNPCSKALLDACDRLGMLMMDEYIDHWYIHKTEYDYVPYFDKWWKQDIADMVDKDYNHPCVCLLYTSPNPRDRG